jgi:hypothetical protein
MNPDDPKPLPSATLALLRAEKGALFAPEDARARVLEKLATAVPGSGGGGSRGGGGNGGEGASGRAAASVPPHDAIVRLARPLSLGVALAVGAAGGAAAWNAFRPLPKAEIVYVDRVVPAPEPAIMPNATPWTSLPNAAASAAKPPRAAVAVEPQPPPATPDGQLAAERTLLDVARTALARGNGGDALAAAVRHEKRYPTGALTEEREAMAIQALVLLGRQDEARARGASFHQRFPGSVLAPALDSALGAIP